MLMLRIFIAVVFLTPLTYLLIDSRIEHGLFRDVLSLARKAIDKCEELTKELKMTLEAYKEVKRENNTLHAILDDPDEFLRKQEEDGNI